MKRAWIIAVLGLVLAFAGFEALYTSRTAGDRVLETAYGPELAWIRKEFQLNDAEFDRVRVLHEAYKPVCARYCEQIDAKNREAIRLLNASTNVTPEIAKLLREAAQLRGECETEMLKHFYQVSQAMPPAQGRRYLDWMYAETLASTHQSMLPRISPSPHGGHEHH